MRHRVGGYGGTHIQFDVVAAAATAVAVVVVGVGVIRASCRLLQIVVRDTRPIDRHSLYPSVQSGAQSKASEETTNTTRELVGHRIVDYRIG